MKKATIIFKKNALLCLLTLLISGLCLSLAYWQYQRAIQKTSQLKAFQEQQHELPWDSQTLEKNYPPPRFQKVIIQGTWDHTHSFLLDNRFHQHRLGYEVLTPFILTHPIAGLSTILVHRGFIPRSEKNHALRPDIQKHNPIVTIQGWIDKAPSSGLKLGQDENNPGQWPRIIQRVDWPMLCTILGKKLPLFMIKLSPQDPAGFIRENKIDLGLPAHRHLGYAIQWLMIGITVLVLFCIFYYRCLK